MNIYYVYQYLREKSSETAPMNTPYYIGKGKGVRSTSKHKNIPMPTDKSRITILAHNLSEHEAWLLEKKLIAYYGRKDLGTGILLNKTDGGDGPAGRIPWIKGKTHSEETRKKISALAKGRFLGRKQSPEHIAKRTKSKSWYKHTKETIKKITESNKKPNPKLSATIKAKGGHSGKSNGMFGKHHSDETKEKYRKMFGKPFIANGVKYLSLADCQTKIGRSIGYIKSQLKIGNFVYIKNDQKSNK